MHVNFTAATSYGALQYLPDVYIDMDQTPVEYNFDKWTVTRILMKFMVATQNLHLRSSLQQRLASHKVACF